MGGVARKSAFVMQVLADVLNAPVKVARSENACALGAAMFAAVVAGIYPNIQAAQESMSSGFDLFYEPNPNHVKIYQALYDQYNQLGSFAEGGCSK